MTRKDYEAIASAIAEARRSMPHDYVQDVVDTVALHVADVLEADNERFDRERFLTAARG